MDLTSIAVMMMAARTQSMIGTAVAASAIRSNLNSEKELAQMLTSSNEQISAAASTAAGLGQNLDMSV